MEIKAKFKPGDVVWAKTQQGPIQMVITQIIVDINGLRYGSGSDIMAPEAALSVTKPTLVLPSEA